MWLVEQGAPHPALPTTQKPKDPFYFTSEIPAGKLLLELFYAV
jgi:hypothetical protein